MGAYGHPLSLTKHAFFVLSMYRGHPKHPNSQTSAKLQGVSKHGWCPSIQRASKQGPPKHKGHPNIQGSIWGASKHTETIQTYGGIQKYGASQHTGGMQMCEAYGHPVSLTKHAFFVLCMYMGHLNIWGYIIYFCIILNYIHHLEFLLSWFFFLIFKYFIHFFKIFF